jgi:hypothetical protein
MKTYFIHSAKLEAVKIGRSIQPVERLKALKNGNPDELQILGLLDGNREHEFHERFKEYRKRGSEWFFLGPSLMDFLKAEFQCVLQQKKRPRRVQPAESWSRIVDRAEKLFGCGLRHGDWDDFWDATHDEIYSRMADVLDEECKESGEELSEAEKELAEDTESADLIISMLQKWWPWVAGWNIKPGGYFDIFLLFRRPSQARMREELLREIAEWGYLSEDEPTEFVRLNVAFCWRENRAGEFVGEIEGPVVVDDESLLFEAMGQKLLIPIALDEAFGFRILGDSWYQNHALPVPRDAIAMAAETSVLEAGKPDGDEGP